MQIWKCRQFKRVHSPSIWSRHIVAFFQTDQYKGGYHVFCILKFDFGVLKATGRSFRSNMYCPSLIGTHLLNHQIEQDYQTLLPLNNLNPGFRQIHSLSISVLLYDYRWKIRRNNLKKRWSFYQYVYDLVNCLKIYKLNKLSSRISCINFEFRTTTVLIFEGTLLRRH